MQVLGGSDMGPWRAPGCSANPGTAPGGAPLALDGEFCGLPAPSCPASTASSCWRGAFAEVLAHGPVRFVLAAPDFATAAEILRWFIVSRRRRTMMLDLVGVAPAGPTIARALRGVSSQPTWKASLPRTIFPAIVTGSLVCSDVTAALTYAPYAVAASIRASTSSVGALRSPPLGWIPGPLTLTAVCLRA